MIPIWFIPCWSGDFRLEAKDGRDDASTLTIERPTANEQKHVRAFLGAARARGWYTGTGPKLTKATVISVDLDVGVGLSAPLLIECVHKGPIWTGVKSVDGVVTVADGIPRLPGTPGNSSPSEVKSPARVAAAATVTAPGVGCPAPEPCNVRASEVLTAFSTARQIEQWNATGFMDLRGGTTGRKYRLFHRNEAAKKGLDHSLIDAKGTLCVWHPTLPAEEEALAIKWMVEHFEGRLWQ